MARWKTEWILQQDDHSSDRKRHDIEFVNDNDKSSTLKIEIGKLVDVSNIGDKDLLGVKPVGDIKLQLTYSYI